MLTTSRSLINFLNTLIERNFSCVESSFKINSHDLITPIYIKKENITLNENNKNTWKIVDVRIRMLPALLILLLQRCQKFNVSYLQRARRCWTRATEFQQNSTKYTAWPEITLFLLGSSGWVITFLTSLGEWNVHRSRWILVQRIMPGPF
jgi:hypothetical protein